MKNWTNRSWLARRLCAVALVLLATASPAHAFQKTALAEGGFEYFFAASSLDIRGSGDLDLTGLSFIEGVTGGFRVGASFDLDWMGGENAWLASPASTWSGVETVSRTLSITADGDMRFGAVKISMPGGTIALAGGGSVIIGDPATNDLGGSGGAVIGAPGLAPPTAGGSITLTGRGGDTGDITQVSGGSGAIINWERMTIGNLGLAAPPAAGVLIRVVGSDPSVIFPVVTLTPNPVVLIDPRHANTLISLTPIPEPASATMLLAGLLALAGFATRRAKAEG